jgi:hypothetical protein
MRKPWALTCQHAGWQVLGLCAHALRPAVPGSAAGRRALARAGRVGDRRLGWLHHWARRAPPGRPAPRLAAPHTSALLTRTLRARTHASGELRSARARAGADRPPASRYYGRPFEARNKVRGRPSSRPGSAQRHRFPPPEPAGPAPTELPAVHARVRACTYQGCTRARAPRKTQTLGRAEVCGALSAARARRPRAGRSWATTRTFTGSGWASERSSRPSRKPCRP